MKTPDIRGWANKSAEPINSTAIPEKVGDHWSHDSEAAKRQSEKNRLFYRLEGLLELLEG